MAGLDAEFKRNLDKVLQTVSRLDEKVSAIQTSQLPEVAVASHEARDGVIQLREQNKTIFRRLRAVEDRPECSRASELQDLSESVAANEATVLAVQRATASIATWGKWFIGLIVTIGLFTIGWQLQESARVRHDVQQTEIRTDNSDREIRETKRAVEKLERMVTERQEEMLRVLREAHDGLLHGQRSEG